MSSATQRFIFLDLFRDLFNRWPWVGIITYGATSALMGLFIFISIRDFLEFPAKPQTMSLDLAIAKAGSKSAWVVIPNLKQDCANVLNTKEDYVIPMTDESGSRVILYDPPYDEKNCRFSGLGAFQGLLEPMNDRRMYYLQKINYRVALSHPQKNIWTLCGYCTPSNSLLMLLFFVPLFLILFYGFYLNVRRII